MIVEDDYMRVYAVRREEVREFRRAFPKAQEAAVVSVNAMDRAKFGNDVAKAAFQSIAQLIIEATRLNPGCQLFIEFK